MKMASTSELDAKEELSLMVRECVRNEIALQRSGNNTSLLMRTRDLIASSARSASREMTNSIVRDIPIRVKTWIEVEQLFLLSIN